MIVNISWWLGGIYYSHSGNCVVECVSYIIRIVTMRLLRGFNILLWRWRLSCCVGVTYYSHRGYSVVDFVSYIITIVGIQLMCGWRVLFWLRIFSCCNNDGAYIGHKVVIKLLSGCRILLSQCRLSCYVGAIYYYDGYTLVVEVAGYIIPTVQMELLRAPYVSHREH